MSPTAVETGANSGASSTGGASTRVPFRRSHLVVHEVGEGPPIGYLHGILGNPGLHPFLSVLAANAKGRVVAPGLPGFSGSPACDDLRAMHDWMVATSEAIDLAGLAGRPVVASSVGAMLALEVAAARPEAFSQLVLIAPLGLWDPEHPVADAFGTTLRRQREMLTRDPSRTALFFEDDRSRPADELVELNVARYLARTAAASLMWPVPDFGLDTRIHRVSCPVTLVWGADDELIAPAYLERFRAALSNVVGTHVVADAGHLVEWDQPDEVARLVAGALATS